MKPRRGEQTLDDTRPDEGARRSARGLLLVFGDGRPRLHMLPMEREPLALGRVGCLDGLVADGRLSRAHAEVSYAQGHFTVTDRASRNGTFVNGRRVEGSVVAEPGATVRVGSTLLLVCADLAPFSAGGSLVHDGFVQGPAFAAALAEARRAAQRDQHLLVVGESGTGKEVVAREFHRAGARASRRMVAVNCAAIPDGVAERLLFGARKGAYSGAEAGVGYFQSADGGILFLDELGELDVAVQAKLLRVLETNEVLALGAVAPTPVDVRICAATNRDLRAEVARGDFRADLYYRLSQPAVSLPALRERPEEIPWHVAAAVESVSTTLRPHARLVELCLTRPWPGNVRELSREVRAAAEHALAAGADVVVPEQLAPSAGLPLGPAEPSSPEPRAAAELTRESVERAIAAAGGNLSAAARALGLHRTQLYRARRRFGLAGDDDDP